MLSAEVAPAVDTATWTFGVEGLVEQREEMDVGRDPGAAPGVYEGPIHCVTTWSKFGMRWTGVSVDTLLAAARPLPSATQ